MRPFPQDLVKWLGLAALLAGAGACAYSGADDRLSMKLQWFAMLGGDDIRATCQAGAPDRLRLVYNGIYQEQARIYDLRRGAGGYGGSVRIKQPLSLGNLALSREDFDALEPLRLKDTPVTLDPGAARRLDDALASDGAFTGGPDGLRLDSDGFYWTIAACWQETFRFNAYIWPSKRFDGLAFPALLLAADPSEVPVNPPRRATKMELYGAETTPLDAAFQLRLSGDRLR